MSKPLYDGLGDAEGKVFWTKDNGEVVGRPYVRQRAVSALARWRDSYSLAARRAAVAATVGSDQWMTVRAGQTVGSIVRDVEDHMLSRMTPDVSLGQRSGVLDQL
jgi:hypothetical protein